MQHETKDVVSQSEKLLRHVDVNLIYPSNWKGESKQNTLRGLQGLSPASRDLRLVLLGGGEVGRRRLALHRGARQVAVHVLPHVRFTTKLKRCTLTRLATHVESAWFQRLIPKYDELLSSFGFSSNLCTKCSRARRESTFAGLGKQIIIFWFSHRGHSSMAGRQGTRFSFPCI